MKSQVKIDEMTGGLDWDPGSEVLECTYVALNISRWCVKLVELFAFNDFLFHRHTLYLSVRSTLFQSNYPSN